MRTVATISASVLVLLGGMVWAQKPAEIPSAPVQPTHNHAAPVQLDVMVTEKNGQPVSGLQAADFTLFDDRQPTPILSFTAHALNDAAPPGTARESAFLLIDDVNTNFNVVSMERTQIENFLRAHQGHLPIPMELLLLTDTGVEKLTPMSDDGKMLADTLHQKAGRLRDLPRAGFWGAAERVGISLRAMETVARYEAQIPGRKLMIWISPGWAVFDNPDVIVTDREQRNLFNMAVNFSTLLRQAQVTLYSIDPLGTWDAAGPRTFLWENYLKPLSKVSQAQPGDMALEVIATQSGGKVYNGSNDITGEIAACAEDASAWYTLTFQPQKSDQPNTWHDLLVKVDRRELKVRTRNGYYAEP